MKYLVSAVRQWGLGGLLIILGGLLLTGFVITFASAYCTARENQTLGAEICLSSSCLQQTHDTFSGTIALAGFFASAATWIATVGGILVALLNYLNSTSATVMGNHVSHSRIFHEYLMWEISRRPTISKDSIDIFSLYSLIFQDSASGDMTPSGTYVEKCKAIANVVESSNFKYSKDSDGYKFTEHQATMIVALKSIGIDVAAMPRIDFYKIEGDALNLISSINTVFCGKAKIGAFPHRNYI